MSTITYVCADDWAGVYVNGRLVVEGHSIDADEWLAAVRLAGGRTDPIVEADLEWMHDMGCLPEKLGHVKSA